MPKVPQHPAINLYRINSDTKSAYKVLETVHWTENWSFYLSPLSKYVISGSIYLSSILNSSRNAHNVRAQFI